LQNNISQENRRRQTFCDSDENFAIRIGLVLGFAVLVGAAGALPHVFFSYDLGEAAFFQGAWDESFYALAVSGRIADWNSSPIRYLAEILNLVTGGPGQLYAMLSDIIWPALVVLSAGVLTLMFTRNIKVLIPTIFLIVFASDVFGFNSVAIYDAPFISSFYLRELPLELRRLISDPYVTFLYLYRTPEPQLSLPFFIIYLAMVTRLVHLRKPHVGDWVALTAASALCVVTYVFFAIGGLMIGAIGSVALALARRWGQAVGVLTVTILSAAWLTSRLFFSYAKEANETLFSSSLPMFAPSMFYGGLFAVIFAWVFRRDFNKKPEYFFAMFCLLIPYVTLNQQIITGIMVQTLNWERYINFIPVVTGVIIFSKNIKWKKIRENLNFRLAIKFVKLSKTTINYFVVLLTFAFIGVFLYSAQLKTYRMFASYNVRTAGYAMLIDKVLATRADAPRNIILDNMSYDAAVRVRLNIQGLVVNGYTSLLAPIDNVVRSGGGNSTGGEEALIHRNWGFDYASRLGLTAEEYGQKLYAEIEAGVCWPHLMFVVKFLECAPYVSDFRVYSPEALAQTVPSISEEYRSYLVSSEGAGRDDALIVLAESGEGDDRNGLWRQDLIESIKLSTSPDGFAPPMTVEFYAYLQRPIAR
jgi:hypothetical protein